MPNRTKIPHEFQQGEALTAGSLNNVQGSILGELDDAQAATQQAIEQLRVNTQATISDLGQRTTATIGDLTKSVDGRFGDTTKAQAGLTQRIGGLEVRADKLEPRVGNLEPRVATTEKASADLSKRADALEGRVGNLEPRVGNLEPRVSTTEKDSAALSKRADALEGRIGTLEVRAGQLEQARTDLLNRLATVERRAPNILQILSQRPGRNIPVLSFDGGAGHVAVPAFTFGGEFTIEAWVYVRSARQWSRFCDFGNGPGGSNVVFGFSSDSGNVFLETYMGNASGGRITSGIPLPLNQWVHVACTVDATGRGIIYFNEQRANGGSPHTGVGGVFPAQVVLRTNNYIGRSNWAADAYLDSLMYGFSLWNVARSQAQIQADMYTPLTGTESGLLLHYPMIDGSGATVRDATSGGRNGTITKPDWRTNAIPAMTFATEKFTTRGGKVMLFASGSGWGNGAQQIGMQVSVDRQVCGYAKSYTNEAGSHKAFVSGALVLDLGKGEHVLTLESFNSTRYDANDFFDVCLIELPS